MPPAAHAAAVRLRHGAEGRMRRSYRQEQVPRHHRAGPGRHAGRRDHHRHHRRLPRRDRGGLPGRRSTSSARPGSPAPSPSSTPSGRARPPPILEDQVPKAVVQERYERLVAVADEVAWAGEPRPRGAHGGADGRRGGGPQGRRDPPALRPGARQPAGALHARRRGGAPVEVRPGDMVEVVVTYGAPHHLVADGPVRSVRRTRAGDAWERRTAEPPAPTGVSLGLPSVGVPAGLSPSSTAARADAAPAAHPAPSVIRTERSRQPSV